MAFTFSNASHLIGTTEWSLVNNSSVIATSSTQCVLQPFIDLVNSGMAAGDQFQLTVYEKINGGTQSVVYRATFTGVQSDQPSLPALIVGEGWDITLKKLAGTDRTIAWSLRKSA
jgi:hypothetical protein